MMTKRVTRRREPLPSSLMEGQSRKSLGGSGAALWAGGEGDHRHQKLHSGLLALIKLYESRALLIAC